METVDINQDTIDRQPKLTDPSEVRIRKVLTQELLSTPWAKSLFDSIKDKQLEFFQTSLKNLDQPENIRASYLQLLKDIYLEGKTKIVEGQENLQSSSQGFIVITNHLGTPKLTSFSPSDIEANLPIDVIEPFPVRIAPVALVADQLNKPIFESSIELPSPLDRVQKDSKIITIPAGGVGRLRQLISNSQQVLDKDKGIIVMYPEGGTSGKRNGGGPYSLEEFQTGAFVTAGFLKVPILPVCQYFNPESGFELGILPAIQVENTDRDQFEKIAKATQNSMQKWLDSRK